MALNFTLSYNDSYDYVPLFPKTKIEALELNETDKKGILKYSFVDITIPPSSNTLQTIPYSFTPKQVSAPFTVFLNSAGGTSEYDYSTMSAVQVTNAGLEITRLYLIPQGSIDVTLVFKEGGI